MNYQKREKIAALVAKMPSNSAKARHLTKLYKLDVKEVTPVAPAIIEEPPVIKEPELPKKVSKKKA
jgi:hypothetical protein